MRGTRRRRRPNAASHPSSAALALHCSFWVQFAAMVLMSMPARSIATTMGRGRSWSAIARVGPLRLISPDAPLSTGWYATGRNRAPSMLPCAFAPSLHPHPTSLVHNRPTAPRAKSQCRSYHLNRYERFRQIVLSTSQDTSDAPIASQSIDKSNIMKVGRASFEVLSTNRRTFNRIWKRMHPLIDLVVDCSMDTGKMRSIADVGCDHGMLSLSLACMAWAASGQCKKDVDESWNGGGGAGFFARVIGTDVSHRALGDGGLASLEKMTASLAPIMQEDHDIGVDTPLPIEFRLGCGLEPLHAGEADAVALAGMGVHTMLDIMLGSDQTVSPVDRVQTRYLFLQPTNSRPQHMMILYDRLQRDRGWVLRDERVAFVGGRWYISSCFERGHKSARSEMDDSYRFPGHHLTRHGGDAYDAYVKHHLQWLHEDHERPKCSLEDEDVRWIEYVISSDERWKDLATWFDR